MPARRLLQYLWIIILTSFAAKTVSATTSTPTPTPSATRTVSFAWHASPSPEVLGYKIFWGTGSYNYQNVRDVKNALQTSLTLSQTAQYYVAVVAYSATETSSFSNQVVVPAQSQSW